MVLVVSIQRGPELSKLTRRRRRAIAICRVNRRRVGEPRVVRPRHSHLTWALAVSLVRFGTTYVALFRFIAELVVIKAQGRIIATCTVVVVVVVVAVAVVVAETATVAVPVVVVETRTTSAL